MEPVFATCAMLALSATVAPGLCVEPERVLRDLYAGVVGATGYWDATIQGYCGTYCDLLVIYPDGAHYCFVFGSTAPTLTRLP